jgi:hypothetical protein
MYHERRARRAISAEGKGRPRRSRCYHAALTVVFSAHDARQNSEWQHQSESNDL